MTASAASIEPRITGKTRVYLIVGDPVAQVRAPEAFNALFREHGVDAVLVPAHVSPEDFVDFARVTLRAHNIAGLWLTVPHKAAVLPLLQHVDRLGRAAGAVNAVRRNADGSLEGALFDGIGFVRGVARAGVAMKGACVFIVGAGGAGAAIAASLAEAGVSRLSIHDRDPSRAEHLAGAMRAAFAVDARAVDADPAGHAIVVNATPLGLKADDPMPLDPSRVDAGAAVFDILMKNQPTPLLRACHARGLLAEPGYEMMIQQAPEYLSFFGFDPIARAVGADSDALRALID